MKENFRENIASRLRELRANKQFTLEKVSIISGVSKDKISRYENNKCSMQIEDLAKILNVYDINLDIFFEGIIAKTQKNNGQE